MPQICTASSTQQCCKGENEEIRAGRGRDSSALPGRKDDDSSLQLLSLQQQRRHIFGSRVKLKDFLSL